FRSPLRPCIKTDARFYLSTGGWLVDVVPAGTVVPSQSGDLPFHLILHVVAIDPFYDSAMDLIRNTMVAALAMVIQRAEKTISMPTLTTGYGPISIADFGTAVAPLANDARFDPLSLTVVVCSDEHRADLSWRGF